MTMADMKIITENQSNKSKSEEAERPKEAWVPEII